MRKLALIIILICITSVGYGQTYEGYSRDQAKAYHCLFQIRPDSTITYIYNVPGNTLYAEYEGQISQLTDSTYTVRAQLAMGHFFMKAYRKDTLLIEMDSSASKRLSKIEVEYANRKNRIIFDRTNPNSDQSKELKIPTEKIFFNAKKGNDIVKITVNWKNQITRKWLKIRLPYGSDASFSQNGEIEFKVLIKDDVLKSIGERPKQTGHIKLVKD